MANAITLKWVFQAKEKQGWCYCEAKDRLVACGFVQQEGVDFDDTFTLIAWMESVQVLAKLAFLDGHLNEEVYVYQLQGFTIPGKEDKVYRLRKALCGLQ